MIVVLSMSFAAFAFAGENQLRLGVINDVPAESIVKYTPLLDYVAERLKGFNIRGSRVVVAKDIDEMVGKIERREVDIVFDSGFSTIKLKENAGMLPRLVVWRKGVREYRTVFFTRKNSPIKSLADLSEKTLALQDAKSTSAFVIPIAELRRNGFAVLPASKKKAPPGAVRYAFARKELNEALWCIAKKADAGAFNTNDWEELPEKVRKELRIFHETKPVLRYIASFHPSLSKDLATAVEDILAGMDKNPKGIKALHEAYNIKKIEKLTAADLLSLDDLHIIMGLIEK